MVAKDPALLARLGVEQATDEAAARICVGKAVKEAKAVGLEFSETEGYEWMRREAKHNDELTDRQLEAVAGGKGPAAGSGASMIKPDGKWGMSQKTVRVYIGISSMGISEIPWKGW